MAEYQGRNTESFYLVNLKFMNCVSSLETNKYSCVRSDSRCSIGLHVISAGGGEGGALVGMMAFLLTSL